VESKGYSSGVWILKITCNKKLDIILFYYVHGHEKFRFHFYSDEGNEPPHIHVATPDGECKFWLQPVRLARNKKSYLNRKSER
jgi:hypothetical protein